MNKEYSIIFMTESGDYYSTGKIGLYYPGSHGYNGPEPPEFIELVNLKEFKNIVNYLDEIKYWKNRCKRAEDIANEILKSSYKLIDVIQRPLFIPGKCPQCGYDFVNKIKEFNEV